MIEDSILYQSTTSDFLSLHQDSDCKSLYIAEKATYVADTIFKLVSDPVISLAGFFFSIYDDDNSCLKDIIDTLKKSKHKQCGEVLELIKSLVDIKEKEGRFDDTVENSNELENAISRKLIMHMRDVHVLLIELVCNLGFLKIRNQRLSEEKFKERADSILQIYSPIASSLGLWRIKVMIEDFYLKSLYNDVYKKIASLLEDTIAERRRYTEDVIDAFERTLCQNGFIKDENFEIEGRSKGIYSTYMKMKQLYCFENNSDVSKIKMDEFNEIINKDISYWFRTVHDLIGVRILCSSTPLCYQALGVIEQKFPREATHRRPDGGIVDYIAAPKDNGYQSIHIVVSGPSKKTVEVQIRTYEMHENAEFGVAAHWKYKATGKSTRASTRDYGVAEIKKVISSKGVAFAQQFLSSINSSESVPLEIHAITPRGEIKSLRTRRDYELNKVYYPTPVDFAYYIHTDIGHRCIGARVNGKMVPLNKMLKDGDIVEIDTSKNQRPRLGWLEFVSTPKAINRIQAWYKAKEREDKFSQGKLYLEKEIGKHKVEDLLGSKAMLVAANKYNYPDVRYMVAELGCGSITTEKIINAYQQSLESESGRKKIHKKKKESSANHRKDKDYRNSQLSSDNIIIGGIPGLVYHLAKCCNPAPGEKIIGVISRTNGISIHRKDCDNAQKEGINTIDSVSWQLETAEMVIWTARNCPGLLQKILSYLSRENINVKKAWADAEEEEKARIELRLLVPNLNQLSVAVEKIKEMSEVEKVKVHCKIYEQDAKVSSDVEERE